jgi:hypothetical protein
MKSDSGFLQAVRNPRKIGRLDQIVPASQPSKPLRIDQGRPIGVVTVRNSFALPEYRFEFIFERLRRNNK